MKRKWLRRLIKTAAAMAILLVVAVAAAVFLLAHRTEGSYFDSKGVRIHYTDEGQGEPVVLLHGFAVNADLNWRRPGITQALSRDFRVIAMDLRGHGLSDKPHDESQYGNEMVNDVIRLLDHLHIEKAHVVGYSLGGSITLKLAATHPHRLITAAPLGVGWERPDNSEFLAAIPKLADALEAGKGIGPIAGSLGAERKKPGLLHRWWVKLMTTYFNDQLALAAVLRGIPNLALTENDVRQISVPLCSIVGSEDPLKVGVDAMDGLVKDHTVTIVENADHIRTPGRPELLEALTKFLREHPPKS